MTETKLNKAIMAGKNEHGENVLILEGEKVKVTKTLQDNGWIRVTREYEDGTVEETYER